MRAGLRPVHATATSYCEDIHDDVFIRKSESTHDIVGIGILNFQHHAPYLRKILAAARIEIDFSEAIPTSPSAV